MTRRVGKEKVTGESSKPKITIVFSIEIVSMHLKKILGAIGAKFAFLPRPQTISLAGVWNYWLSSTNIHGIFLAWCPPLRTGRRLTWGTEEEEALGVVLLNRQSKWTLSMHCKNTSIANQRTSPIHCKKLYGNIFQIFPSISTNMNRKQTYYVTKKTGNCCPN